MKKPKKSGSKYNNKQELLFPGVASPGLGRIQFPLGRCWVIRMHSFLTEAS